MKMKTLGRDGPSVSVIGVGCNMLGAIDFETSRKVVHTALDLGVTFFETADFYGNGPEGKGTSETYLGDILRGHREKVFVATKFGLSLDGSHDYADNSRAYLNRALDESLKRLRTDYIDLYQVHQPDENTPIEETLDALDEVVRAGKVRHVGLANHPAAAIQRARDHARRTGCVSPVTVEDEYNILVRHLDTTHRDLFEQEGMGLLPFFPLANGLLTGKFTRGVAPSAESRLGKVKFLADRYMTPATWDVLDRLRALGESHGRSVLDYALGWLAAKPFVSCIIAGATSDAQVAANVAAAQVVLSREETEAIDQLAVDIPRFDARPYMEYEHGLNLRDPASYLRPVAEPNA